MRHQSHQWKTHQETINSLFNDCVCFQKICVTDPDNMDEPVFSSCADKESMIEQTREKLGLKPEPSIGQAEQEFYFFQKR